jgi:hypothetical protein
MKNKKLVTGMGVALIAGVVIGVTVLGGAFASPKVGAPDSTSPAAGNTTSGSAIIMQATPAEIGKLPVIAPDDPNMKVIDGAGTVMVSTDGHVVSGAASNAIPAGAVTGTIVGPDGKAIPIPAGSGTVTLNASSSVSATTGK